MKGDGRVCTGLLSACPASAFVRLLCFISSVATLRSAHGEGISPSLGIFCLTEHRGKGKKKDQTSRKDKSHQCKSKLIMNTQQRGFLRLVEEGHPRACLYEAVEGAGRIVASQKIYYNKFTVKI